MQEDIKKWTKENEDRRKRFQEKQKEEAEKGASLHRNPVRFIFSNFVDISENIIMFVYVGLFLMEKLGKHC